ncbi:UDP-N-acetylmuramoyl-L-alanine--D-glutamate ligase [Virgibacillus soli]|uniref:UDP-N-acetylmuramoyl-L-alanine--D-glutamate ligase n=1 Tax=Paracerasibacillus soli TaxID=480284 RepID=UPI0035E59E83
MNELNQFPYSNILVLGLAKSGSATAKLLCRNGKRVRVNDLKTNTDDPIVQELRKMGAEVILGSHPLSVLDGVEVIVKNPGISYENPVLMQAQQQNIPIITEVELTSYMTDRIIGITGSNGKTTTTMLIHEMLENSNCQTKLAGNIGTAVASEVAEMLLPEETLVLELSSFQLMGTEKFKPHISVLLNIFEAHLDFHHTLANYVAAKRNIIRNQTIDDVVVYNLDDQTVSEMIKHTAAKKVPFSLTKRLPEGAWLDKEYIYFREEKVISRKDIVLVGSHNLQNILAAICTSKLAGANNEGIRHVLTTFTGVKHRLQFVGKIHERLFYNDSKATNMLATEKALASFTQPTILLAGGLDRGNEFDSLIPHLQYVKAIVVFGQTGEKLKRVAEEADIPIVIDAENVTDAVGKSFDISKPGDVILLSPACASWDQYKTFEQRGDMFIQAVHTLK